MPAIVDVFALVGTGLNCHTCDETMMRGDRDSNGAGGETLPLTAKAWAQGEISRSAAAELRGSPPDPQEKGYVEALVVRAADAKLA